MITIPPDPEKGVISKDGGPILSFQLDRVSEISVTAFDRQGDVVAHGIAVPDLNPSPTSSPAH